MKVKILMLTAAMMSLAAGAWAQEVSIGVKGGITIPSIAPGGKKTPLSEGYSSRLAWGAGAFTELRFSKLFSLQIGLEYSGQGGQKDKIQAIPAGQITPLVVPGLKTGVTAAGKGMGLPDEDIAKIAALADGLFPDDYMYADFKSTAKFNYLMLPVQAKFGWNLSKNTPVRFYVSAGLFASYLLKAERVSKGTSKIFADNKRTPLADHVNAEVGKIQDPIAKGIYTGIMEQFGGMMAVEQSFSQTQDITDEIYRFNFGFIGAIGITYEIAPRHSIFIEGGGNYGFKKIQKNDVNGQNRIGAGSVMVGYSFRL